MPIAPLRKKYIGEILLTRGLITREQLSQALRKQKETKEKIGEILLKAGHVSRGDLFKALAFQLGLTFIELSKVKLDEGLHKIIPQELANRFSIIPVSKDNKILTIAMADPADVVAIDEIKTRTNLKVSAVLATEDDIKKAIEKFYGGLIGIGDLPGEAEVEEIREEEELPEGEYEAEDAPIVKYVNSFIYEAISRLASDVHLEPMENDISLRIRIDGKLKVFPPPPKRSYSAILSRVKIMANLDIAERRLPQDGKCKLKIGDKKVDIRVSTLPTIYGEKLVMRILDRSSVSLSMEKLGFSRKYAEKYKSFLNNPYGMILVTGPTGSGKTTTLYAGLNYINQPEKNIITIEDPVEYELERVNQVQVKPQIELNFANILRSVLRQDPDVIMVGEIRDRETAEIAIQAALTGHLVLSTLHTGDAVGTLSRLKYMGIEPYLIADAVNLVIAQRLLRKICPNCKKEQQLPPNILKKINIKEDIKFYYGKGCNACFDSGYKGRTAIYEILDLSTEIKKMLMAEISDIEIKEKAIEEGMTILRDSVIEKLKEGITTVEEVLSVTLGEKEV